MHKLRTYDPKNVEISFGGVSITPAIKEDIILIDSHEEVSIENNDIFDDCYVHGQITGTLKSIDMSFWFTLCNTFECLNLREECQA